MAHLASSKSLRLILIALVYFVAARLGLMMDAVGGVATTVWPPTGIALAALLLFGYQLWPAIAVAAFAVNFSVGVPLFGALGMALGNTSEALIGAYLLKRYFDFRPSLERLRDAVSLVVCAGVLSTLVSATIGVTSGWLTGVITLSDYGSAWRSWWIGDMLSDLVVAPALLTWSFNPRVERRLGRVAEAFSLAVAVALLSVLVFAKPAPLGFTDFPPPYFLFPFLIWAALRFGPRGVSAVTLVVSAVAIGVTAQGYGPFVRPSVNESLLVLQTFVGLVAVTFLVLAALVAERSVAEATVRRARDELELRVEERTRQLKESNDLLYEEVLERRRVEASLQASMEKWRVVVGTATDAIVLADTGGTIISFNRAAELAFGYQEAEVLGKPLTVLMPERFHGEHQAGLRRYLDTGEARAIGKTLELAGKRKNGEEFPLELSLATSTADGVVFFTAIIRDITARRQAEEEIRKLNADLNRRAVELEAVNRELETFSYSVSHDLRAPVRRIEGFSLSLLEECERQLGDKGRDYLRRIRASCEQMVRLIEDLLQLSRVARSEMRREPVDLGALARQITAELQKSDPKRSVQSVIGEGLVASGDERLLRVALENLLANAWKFTGKREDPRIEFGMVQRNGQPTFYVRDNGVGFDMAYADRLFGAFQRLHEKGEFPGTGIGLATVQRIVHRHGGRIWAESEAGKGATFFFTLGA